MRIFQIFVAGLILSLPLASRAAPPATQPVDDGLAAEAVAAADGGLIDFAKNLSDRATPILADLKTANIDQLARISLYREYADYFGRITEPTDEQKATIKWLAGQPHLLPVLMGAVSPQDAPDALLRVLSALQKDSSSKLDQYPELATAFLVTFDKPNKEAGSKAVIALPAVLRLFHYYTNSKILRFNVKDLPWQLAVYMVNVKVSEPEILWAADRYAHRDQIGAVYFEVTYDITSFLAGAPEKIDSHPYTLQNLLKYGGICVDQAYFATQVSKVVGVPSCVCTGQGGAGQVGHAWVGYLQMLNRGVSWDFSQGRYKEDLFWAAEITDPQTQQSISDADVALLAELSHIDPDARLQSEGLTKLIDLGDAPTRVQLLTRAIDLCPGNRPAWMQLAKLGEDHQLTDAQISAIGDVISRRISQPYPQFACNMLVKLASAGDIDHQIAALDKIAVLFKGRPDLVAGVRIEEGDRLHQANKNDRAFAAYGDVLANELDAGPVVLTAMKRIDDLLRDANAVGRLLAIYKQVFNRMPAPDPSSFAMETPYYKLGEDYASLLDEVGDHTNAMAIRSRIGSLLNTMGQQKPR